MLFVAAWLPFVMAAACDSQYQQLRMSFHSPASPATAEGAAATQPVSSEDGEVRALDQRINALADRIGHDDGDGQQVTERPLSASSMSAHSDLPATVGPTAMRSRNGQARPILPPAGQGERASSYHPASPEAAAASRNLAALHTADSTAFAANTPVSANMPSGDVAAGEPQAARTDLQAAPLPPAGPAVTATHRPGMNTLPPLPTSVGPALPPPEVKIVDIRPAAAIPMTAAGTDATASANQPAQGQSARPADLRAYVDVLEESLRQQPPHLEGEFRLRLLYLAAGMDDKALGAIDGMDPVQAQLLTAVFETMASARKAILDPTEPNPEALTATDELRRLLGQQSGVYIPRALLVTRVNSFGDYTAITPLVFRAGEEIHAYVYTEVANFHSEPTEDGMLRTQLSEKVQLFDSASQMVWERQEASIEDRVRTPRRDFFIPFPIHLPATLKPGEYVLKATIEDRIGGTLDQRRISFSIR